MLELRWRFMASRRSQVVRIDSDMRGHRTFESDRNVIPRSAANGRSARRFDRGNVGGFASRKVLAAFEKT